MSKMNQKECVFGAIAAYLEENDRLYELDSGKAIELSKTDKSTVVAMVCAARSEMELRSKADAKFNTPQLFKNYVIGLVNNWVRKDTRLNGGVKHTIKNPGSRAGRGDNVIKALKALKSTLTNADEVAQVEAAIATRTSEVVKVKPAVIINLEALPEQFRHLVK